MLSLMKRGYPIRNLISSFMTMSPMDCTSIFSILVIVLRIKLYRHITMAFLSFVLMYCDYHLSLILCPNYASSWNQLLSLVVCPPYTCQRFLIYIFSIDTRHLRRDFFLSLVYICTILRQFLIVNTIFNFFSKKFSIYCYVNYVVFSFSSECIYCLYNLRNITCFVFTIYIGGIKAILYIRFQTLQESPGNRSARKRPRLHLISRPKAKARMTFIIRDLWIV